MSADNLSPDEARGLERAWRLGLMALVQNEGVDLETRRDVLRELIGVLNRLSGVACRECGGEGVRVYGSTATWRGGVGGQAMTQGVCDSCWGTGRADRTGPDRRRIEQERRALLGLLFEVRKSSDASHCWEPGVEMDCGGCLPCRIFAALREGGVL